MSGNATDLPRTFLYRLARTVVTAFFRLCYRIRVEGLEHVPRSGGIIIASNHLSNLDPPLLGVMVPRYIRFMGKAELFQIAMLRALFSALGGFPIQRGRIDKQGIRKAISIVEEGGCLVMFPEGHRSKTGQLGPLMPGVASIARKSNATVVPTGIVGPYRLFGRVTIRFGEPFVAGEFSSDDLLSHLSSELERLLAVKH
ncbi:1-acyl-sn-glycerol-3-phosphate acyltransferase [Alicyclobacillus hesperidum subsp. aegles]|uniref:lysophospholipid acyltransferase family protein n=1 Tax=Alicyclobacillus hesperidum TaxID=89784 RepID=UPI00071912AD|nr:lysophospholipid acyltransferase family protein [Alicyclobacillus hesperidum]KRW90888.1 glycerol acyltransferase [Alicyclobacillus tengchongensis]GLG00833.1 1-acyl-sn-glycerol-3-phosphate acyltransferase [Alicyclobacillus hesperidum subsp. aegles]